MYVYTSIFSAMFSKGDNFHDFPFGLLGGRNEVSQRKESAPIGPNSFS